MKAYTFYRHYIKTLETINSPGESATITSIIFEKFAGLKKIDVITFPEKELTELQYKNLSNALNDLLKFKPVQYVVEEAWFYKLKFRVNSSVLIPRPETEELVSMVIEFINLKSSKNILDIGTGSGCIPISIKKNIPAANLTAADISPNALKTAKENAVSNNTEINFIEADFLDKNNWPLFKKFDVIVSNPPYIPFSENNLIAPNVKDFEPSEALFVEDALIFYKAIAGFGKLHLNSGGKIFMEVHEDYAGEVFQHFLEQGYSAKIVNDMLGKQRFVTANIER